MTDNAAQIESTVSIFLVMKAMSGTAEENISEAVNVLIAMIVIAVKNSVSSIIMLIGLLDQVNTF